MLSVPDFASERQERNMVCRMKSRNKSAKSVNRNSFSIHRQKDGVTEKLKEVEDSIIVSTKETFHIHCFIELYDLSS